MSAQTLTQRGRKGSGDETVGLGGRGVPLAVMLEELRLN